MQHLCVNVMHLRVNVIHATSMCKWYKCKIYVQMLYMLHLCVNVK